MIIVAIVIVVVVGPIISTRANKTQQGPVKEGQEEKRAPVFSVL